jgi:quinolinate synthase
MAVTAIDLQLYASLKDQDCDERIHSAREKFRKSVPDGKVISQPEASFEVCQMSDYVGSTHRMLDN